MCLWDGLIIVAAAFNIFPEFFSRPVALELELELILDIGTDNLVEKMTSVGSIIY